MDISTSAVQLISSDLMSASTSALYLGFSVCPPDRPGNNFITVRTMFMGCHYRKNKVIYSPVGRLVAGIRSRKKRMSALNCVQDFVSSNSAKMVSIGVNSLDRLFSSFTVHFEF